MTHHKTQLTDGYVLCQDCGHVEEYTKARHMEQEKCSKCGGVFCGCDCCNRVALASLQLRAVTQSTSEGKDQ